MANLTELFYPAGVLFDTQQNLYISDFAGIIRKVAQSTQIVSNIITGLDSPAIMSFDSYGNMIVGSYGSEVLKISGSVVAG